MNVRENQESTPFDDLIYRTEEIESIIKVIEGEYADEEDDYYVFAINGEYGSGKTKFLELFEKEIEKNHSDRVLKINAWRDSFANDPLLSICYGFYEYFENLKKKSSSKKWDKTISAINKCGKFAVFAGNATLAGAPNAGFDAISEGSDTKIFENFRSLRSSLADVKESLEKYVKQKNKKSETKKPTYILVDELDRCSPKYAVKFLETIHHFFCVEGLVFVIAIDQSQLRSYVEKIYGVDDDRFDSWYAKFIKASYNLQSMWDKMAKNQGDNLKSEYIEKKFSKINIFKVYDKEEIIKILRPFELPLRQINFFIKNLKRYCNLKKLEEHTFTVNIAAFLIALRLKNSARYHELINLLKSNERPLTAEYQKSDDAIKREYDGIIDRCHAIIKKCCNSSDSPQIESTFLLPKAHSNRHNYDNNYVHNHPIAKFLYEDFDFTKSVALTIHEQIEEMKDFG